jgi:hypothetical protein
MGAVLDSRVARPVAGVDYPRTYQQLREWFADEQSCLEYLERLRWPDGFSCPACGNGGAWRTGTGLWMCTACERRTSVTAGTIFHRTRTPLSTWFAAIWFVTSQKNGVSALGLQRVLGFGSYETAWAWLHKLRRAMVRPDRDLLGGPGLVVELDETLVGGVTHGGRTRDKQPVMIAAEAGPGRKIGRIRLDTADGGANSSQLLDFASEVIAPASTVRTDGAIVLRRLPSLGYQHDFVVGTSSPDPAHIHLPAVHLVASLLKRWLTGTLHYAASEAQLPYYLDEFTFRFNRRNARSRGLLFYRLLQQAVDTEPHPLRDLHA